MATGTQTKTAPTAGGRDRNAIKTAHKSAARTPRNQKISPPRGRFPIAQQEEKQLWHDEKFDDDLECGLADNDGLTGKEQAPSVGQFLLHRGKIGQPEAIEQFGHP
jgi:hypothetical protein